MLKRIFLIAFLLLAGSAGLAFADDADRSGGSIQTVSAGQIEAAAAEALRQRLGMDAGDSNLQLTLAAGVADVQVPAGQLQLTANLPYGVRYSGPTVINVLISVDDRLYERAVVRYVVSAYRQVIIAARPLRAREVISLDAVRLERMEVGRLYSGYLTDLGSVVGMAANRTLAAGSVITPAMLNKPIVVKQASAVQIIVRMGNMEISAPGIALQNGVQDQVIRVQNANSHKTITAKVVNAATVLAVAYGK